MWHDAYPQIIKLSLELLSYDPNYNYESDDDDEGMDTDELEQDELYGFVLVGVHLTWSLSGFKLLFVYTV